MTLDTASVMQLLADSSRRDVYANIPPAALTGRLFFATDRGAWYFDTGSTWVQLIIGSGGSSSTLASDTDVAITSPSDLQELVYYASTGKWTNKTVTRSILTDGNSTIVYANGDVIPVLTLS